MTDPDTPDQPRAAAPFTLGWKIFVVFTFLLTAGIGGIRTSASEARRLARGAGADAERAQRELQALQRSIAELERRLEVVERR